MQGYLALLQDLLAVLRMTQFARLNSYESSGLRYSRAMNLGPGLVCETQGLLVSVSVSFARLKGYESRSRLRDSRAMSFGLIVFARLCRGSVLVSFTIICLAIQ